MQVVGRKYIRLYHPAETPNLYPKDLDRSHTPQANKSNAPQTNTSNGNAHPVADIRPSSPATVAPAHLSPRGGKGACTSGLPNTSQAPISQPSQRTACAACGGGLEGVDEEVPGPGTSGGDADGHQAEVRQGGHINMSNSSRVAVENVDHGTHGVCLLSPAYIHRERVRARGARERETETERDRERQRETERDRETERQRQRQRQRPLLLDRHITSNMERARMRMLVYVQRHCIGMFVCVQDIVHHIISIWNKPIRPFFSDAGACARGIIYACVHTYTHTSLHTNSTISAVQGRKVH